MISNTKDNKKRWAGEKDFRRCSEKVSKMYNEEGIRRKKKKYVTPNWKTLKVT